MFPSPSFLYQTAARSKNAHLTVLDNFRRYSRIIARTPPYSRNIQYGMDASWEQSSVGLVEANGKDDK
jgi:hypothetical protein